MQKNRLTAVLILALLATGCTVTPQAPEAPALANSARDQIGRLAVRGPTRPMVMLADDLQGKGAAAGTGAASASAEWISGTVDAAADGAGEGGLLVLVLGLASTPIVAVGGAAYGAAVADTPAAVTGLSISRPHSCARRWRKNSKPPHPYLSSSFRPVQAMPSCWQPDSTRCWTWR